MQEGGDRPGITAEGRSGRSLGGRTWAENTEVAREPLAVGVPAGDCLCLRAMSGALACKGVIWGALQAALAVGTSS